MDSGDAEEEKVKHSIIQYVRRAVRELQKEYVASRDVIPSSELTNSLCYGIEAVFLHGLLGVLPDKLSSVNFWPILSKHIHKSSLSDIESLSQIKTDIGRCRVWIRLALNGCEFDSYLRLILADDESLKQFYETWSFIRDHECMDLMLTTIQGLECVHFHLGHNSTVLNEWSNASLSLAGGHLVTGLGTKSSDSDLNDEACSSFDDYELSPDDREEVRLMFRFENIQNSSCDLENGTAPQKLLGSQEFEEATEIDKADIKSIKQFQNVTSNTETFNGYSHQDSDPVDSPIAAKPRMTDEMRDTRFERIVRENLERYPLDYDRDLHQNQAEVTRSRTLNDFRRCNNAQNRANSPIPDPHFIASTAQAFPDDDVSGAEPDEFWKTLNDEDWHGGESAAEVLGNSLPRDTWIGPPSINYDCSAPTFSPEVNDRIRNELEASYGTILADYQRAMPQQFKMVAAEDAGDLQGDLTDGGAVIKSLNKGSKDSAKRSVDDQPSFGVKVDEEWVVVEDDCPFISEPYHVDASCEWQLTFVTQRFVRRADGIHPNQKCRGCSKEIEDKNRMCNFDGFLYCVRCHCNDLIVVPSQIIFNWDFQRQRVAVENYRFLKKIYDWPLINIQESNPELYRISKELSLVRDLRQQSYHLAGYMFHCTSAYAAKYWRAMNARLYYFSHIDNYSLQDLVNVQSGSFRKALKKINDSAIDHVYRCEYCRAKGFYCEICQNSDIIFPFELSRTAVCEICKNTYHKGCKLSEELACPKCLRIELRKTASNDPIDRVLFTHPTDVLTI